MITDICMYWACFINPLTSAASFVFTCVTMDTMVFCLFILFFPSFLYEKNKQQVNIKSTTAVTKAINSNNCNTFGCNKCENSNRGDSNNCPPPLPVRSTLYKEATVFWGPILPASIIITTPASEGSTRSYLCSKSTFSSSKGDSPVFGLKTCTSGQNKHFVLTVKHRFYEDQGRVDTEV